MSRESKTYFTGTENGAVKYSEFARPCMECGRITNYKEYNYYGYVCSVECLAKFEEKVEQAFREES